MTQWLSQAQQGDWRAFLSVTALLPDQFSRDLQKSHGLTMADYEILVRLSEAPERAIRMSELAVQTLATRSRLTHQIDRMVEEGLVERKPCTDDKRGFFACMTDAGWAKLVAAAPDHVDSVRQHLVDVLSADEFASWDTSPARFLPALTPKRRRRSYPTTVRPDADSVRQYAGLLPHFSPVTEPQNRNIKFAADIHSLYPFIVAVFASLLLISNIGATKLIQFGPVITDGGAFLFPLVYIIGDVMSEVYGWKAARRAILLGFAMAVLASVTFYAVQISPAAPGWDNQSAFEAILGFVPRIVLASISGFLVGQLLNSYVLVWIKRRTNERLLWVRLIGSTVVGELADTAAFCTIAFYGIITGSEFANYVITGYVYKTLLEVVLLPITYPTIRWVKRHEPTYRESVAV